MIITIKAGGNSNNTAKIKMTTFRKVNLEIRRAGGYGQYIISANYKGKHIEVHTNNMEAQKRYITGRNSESFTDLDEAKKYANKWGDKSISVYQEGKYHSTIHKKDGKWQPKK